MHERWHIYHLFWPRECVNLPSGKSMLHYLRCKKIVDIGCVSTEFRFWDFGRGDFYCHGCESLHLRNKPCPLLRVPSPAWTGERVAHSSVCFTLYSLFCVKQCYNNVATQHNRPFTHLLCFGTCRQVGPWWPLVWQWRLVSLVVLHPVLCNPCCSVKMLTCPMAV